MFCTDSAQFMANVIMNDMVMHLYRYTGDFNSLDELPLEGGYAPINLAGLVESISIPDGIRIHPLVPIIFNRATKDLGRIDLITIKTVGGVDAVHCPLETPIYWEEGKTLQVAVGGLHIDFLDVTYEYPYVVE